MAELLEPFAGKRAGEAADRLIDQFGSLGRTLAASPEQLLNALGKTPDIARSIVAARRLVEAALHERVISAPISPRDADFRQYLIGLIGRSPTERLHATFVGADRGYLADETLTEGAASQVEGDLRRLLARAFDLGALGIILAHNHPSGSSEPSADDIRLTRRIADLTGSVDISLLDHLVVSRSEVVSMRDRGLL